MKKRFKYIYLIDDYLSGKLDDKQRDLFLKKLRTDKQFAFEVGEYITIYRALTDREAINFRKQLKEIVKKQTISSFSETSIKTFVFQSLSYAALILVLISLNIVMNYFFLVNLRRIGDFSIKELSYSNRLFRDSLNSGYNKSISENTADSHTYIYGDSVNENKPSHIDSSINNRISEEHAENNYLLNHTFSELLLSNFRSTKLIVLEPPDSSKYFFEDTISFSWETNLDSNIFLEVLNNHGQIIFELPLDSLSNYKLVNKFAKGAYIVKFRNESEILDLRIFFVY